MSEYEAGVKLVCGRWFNKAQSVIDASRHVRDVAGGESCANTPESKEYCPYCAMDKLTKALDELKEVEHDNANTT